MLLTCDSFHGVLRVQGRFPFIPQGRLVHATPGLLPLHSGLGADIPMGSVCFEGLIFLNAIDSAASWRCGTIGRVCTGFYGAPELTKEVSSSGIENSGTVKPSLWFASNFPEDPGGDEQTQPKVM